MVVTDGHISRSGLHHVLDAMERNQTHNEKKGKSQILVHSFLSPFKFGSLSACEKLLERNRDFAARSELQGWNRQQ